MLFHATFYSIMHFITELQVFFLFPENSIMNILTKDTCKSQNMKYTTAVHCVKTESVDAATEIRKEKKKILRFFAR